MASSRPVTAGDIEKYLYENIPISKVMGVSVTRAEDDSIHMCAPFEPNVNHRGTIFGGSAGTLSILTAWAVVYRRMRQQGLNGNIVIQSNCVDYEKPMTHNIHAICHSPEQKIWERFETGLRRWNKARVILHAKIFCKGELVGRFEGKYVAIKDK